MKHLSARRFAAGLAVTALAAATVAVTGGAAQAAPGDFNDPLPQSYTPTSGTNLTVPTVTVPQGCPVGTDVVVGELYGGTLPVDGQLMYGPANGPSTSSFTYQPQAFQDTFSDAGIAVIPAGSYSLFTRCIDGLGNNVRVYSAPITFTSATVYGPVVGATTTALTAVQAPLSPFAVTLSAVTGPVAAAGSVEFFDGAASLGVDSTVPYGITTGGNTAGSSHVYKAVFSPTDTATYASSQDTKTVVIVDGSAPHYDVTTTVAAGALTLTVPNPNVSLGTMVFNPASGKLESGGSLTAATLIDLRSTNPGWTVSGVTTNFAGTPTGSINGANLGWIPAVIDAEAGMTVTAGPSVAGAGGVQAADPSVAGLKTSRVMASAASGAGHGTAHLGGTLQLQAPTSTPAGSYAATLTLTAI